MRKLKFLFLLVITMLIIAQESVAYAADDITVTSRGTSVRELSQIEMETLSREMSLTSMGEEMELPMVSNASYTAYEYSELFDFSLGETWIASADARCIVWHYTDGKVHLYQRTITVRRLSSYDAVRTYGRIVNTDGSLSYTTGDRVTIIDYDDFWEYAIDFRVTPTEASFDCYEV